MSLPTCSRCLLSFLGPSHSMSTENLTIYYPLLSSNAYPNVVFTAGLQREQCGKCSYHQICRIILSENIQDWYYRTIAIVLHYTNYSLFPIPILAVSWYAAGILSLVLKIFKITFSPLMRAGNQCANQYTTCFIFCVLFSFKKWTVLATVECVMSTYQRVSIGFHLGSEIVEIFSFVLGIVHQSIPKWPFRKLFVNGCDLSQL